MSVFEVPESLEFHWTPSALIRAEMQPLVAGDAVTWRFQYLDSNGAAVDLSGMQAAWLVTQYEELGSPVVWSRKTGVLISGSTFQMAFDANQATETTDVNGNPTGRGWMAINHRLEDEDGLNAVIASARYGNLCLRQTGNLPITLLRGDVKVLRRRGALSDIPTL